MNGKQHYEVLKNAHSREHLLEHAKNNGVSWDEHHQHEGVNWMRASGSLVDHLDKHEDFHLDDMDLDTANSMLDNYKQLREHHKSTMYPHLRSAMAKLHSEKADANTPPLSLLDEAHAHLDANGGHVWREKVNTLSHFNRKIKYLDGRIQNMSKDGS